MSNPDQAANKLFDVVQDIGQRAIDVICSDDIAKTIPGVKIVVAGAAAFQSVRDEILNSKLDAFIDPLREITTAERCDMVDRLESDPKYRRKVGVHIIEVLDRQESYRKPRMTGEIFAAFARKEIDLVMFQRLLNAVDRLPATEIDTVRRFVESSNSQPERDKIDAESIQAMVNAGLLGIGVLAPFGGSKLSFHPNLTCSKFVELNLDLKSEIN
jgi:hypothetical protein